MAWPSGPSRWAAKEQGYAESRVLPSCRWIRFAFAGLIAVIAFAVRLAAFIHFGAGTIESEGAEYARLAENLRNGAGYVGIASAGPQVLFQPLFPVLIAGASLLVHNYETAGRTVCLIMGSVLPLPIFGIATHLFNRRVGYIAAILASLHPLLVQLSFSIYSETPYATLLFFSIYLTIRALEKPSIWRWTSAGAAFSFAYLIRPEGLAAFAITLLFGVAAIQQRMVLRLKFAACALLAFLVFATPQIVFLFRATGSLMVEGRSKILFAYGGSRMLQARRNPGVDFKNAGVVDAASPEPDMPGGYPDNWADKWALRRKSTTSAHGHGSSSLCGYCTGNASSPQGCNCAIADRRAAQSARVARENILRLPGSALKRYGHTRDGVETMAPSERGPATLPDSDYAYPGVGVVPGALDR